MNTSPSPVCAPNSDHPNQIETPQPELRTPHSNARRRTGKVASLPKSERDLVNQLLEDGAPYTAIVDALAQRGCTLSARNISNWFQGGYQDWLLLQQRLATHQLHEEAALDLLSHRDIDLSAAGLQIVATHLCQVLLALQPHRIDPESGLNNYLRAANAFCRISRQLIQIQKFHDQYDSDSIPIVSDKKTANEPISSPPVVPLAACAGESEPQIRPLATSGSKAPGSIDQIAPLASPPDEALDHATSVIHPSSLIPHPSSALLSIPAVSAAISTAQNAPPEFPMIRQSGPPPTTTATCGNLWQPKKINGPSSLDQAG